MADKLKRYREKRDFSRTGEPAAAEGRSAGVLRFVVQKHAASRLHYDFRLEYEGVLKSWAVTRGPSLDPHEKRLAVETEDHPLDYATFEGTIPKGEYGGGTVMVWDEGTWAMADGKDAAEGFSHGSLSFDLFGRRMKGRWHLQRMRPEKGRPPPWLLVKAWDDEARDLAKGGEDITEAFADSAATGRTMEAIAKGDAVWHSNRAASETGDGPKPGRASKAREAGEASGRKSAAEDASRALDGEREPPPAPRAERVAAEAEPARRRVAAKVPAFIEPALCEPRDAPPKGAGWLAEVKYDGYRALLRATGGEVRILTRSNLDWTARFPDIARAAERLVDRDVLLDGEIVVFDDHGRTRFAALQKAFSSAGAIRATYVAFDCLFDGGVDVRAEPIEARKARVAALVGREGPIRYGDHIENKQVELYARAAELGLEGIVAKRAGSPYRSGRHGQWVKVQARRRGRFVVGAWTDSKKDGALGALVVGAWRDGTLVPLGRVGTGFTHAELARVKKDLETIAAEKTPFSCKLEGRGHHFVRPERVAEVSFLTVTDDGQLRAAVYHGMVDMDPREATLPSGHPLAQDDRQVAPPGDPPAADAAPAATPARRGKTATEGGAAQRTPARRRAGADGESAAGGKDASDGGGAAQAASEGAIKATAGTGAPAAARQNVEGAVVRKGSAAEVLGVRISHPDKVLFAEQHVTKLALAEHYLRHMERILPHVVERPLTLVRCPAGAGQKCFFQRHPEGGLPPRFARDVGEDDGAAIVVEAAADIIALVQMGVLEIHLRGARWDKPDLPDRLVFDLDPGEGVTFEALKEAAFDVRAALGKVDLESFVKTTGGKGLHVVVPVERNVPWEKAKAWTRAFAEIMADAEPNRFLITMTKAKRKNRIFIDYLRNDRKASAVAPYSSRSRAGAPFSFPVTWEELEALGAPAPLHVGDEAPGDPWADMGKVKQRLTAAHLKGIEA